MCDHDDYESLPETVSPAVHMLAGAAAGMLEHTAMYPFDVVKTRLQKVNPSPGGLYTGVAHCMRKMVRTEGFPSLFRGMNAVLIGAGPAHALYFSVYEHSKKQFGATTGASIPTAMSAVCAAVAHDGFMNPIEVVKQRMQVYGSPYQSTFHCMQSILLREGVGAFYRSFSTQLLMNIPFQTTYLVGYEACRKLLNPSGEYNPFSHLVSGAFAGGLAAALTTPMDVVKTFLNTQEACKGATAGVEAQLPAAHRSISLIAFAVRSVYQAYGMRGFVRGLSARVVASSPAAAISWSVYEFFKHYLGLFSTVSAEGSSDSGSSTGSPRPASDNIHQSRNHSQSSHPAKSTHAHITLHESSSTPPVPATSFVVYNESATNGDAEGAT